MGHYREAQGVHENVLRLVVEGDDGDDRTQDHVSAEVALEQVELLKQSFLRLGGWDKSRDVYADLIHELKHMHEFDGQLKHLKPINEWNAKEQASEHVGKFQPPTEWEFGADDDDGDKEVVRHKRKTLNVKRATSNWGIGLVHRFLHGDEEAQKRNGGGGGKVSSNGHVNGSGVATAGATAHGHGDDGFESASEEL